MKNDWQAEFGHQDYQIDRDDVICDSFYQMREVTVSHSRFAGGKVTITRDLFWRPDAVCVLLYDPVKDAIVLIEQFRIGTIDHPKSPWLLELVAGLVEEGESFEDVARREAVEESGTELGLIEPITHFSPSPGGAREYIQLFCAQVDSSKISGVFGLEEEGEDIKVHVFNADDVYRMVREGVIDNAPAIIAIQWLQLNRDWLVDKWMGNA